MYRKINVINPEAVLKAFNDFKCGKTNIVEINSKDFEVPQYEMQPLSGFELPVNKQTGAKFPLCCEYHIGFLKQVMDYLLLFPNCCESHKKLLTAKWFNKKDYNYVPLKVVATVQFTFHCIEKCIENENWYNEITNYIDVTIKSYGQLPNGYGEPVGIKFYVTALEDIIEKLEIPENKKLKLIEFIGKLTKPVKERKNFTSLNLLNETYKKWLKIFPFELSYFSHLKPHFEQQLPILKGEGVKNLYTNWTAYETLTNKELIAYLVKTTETLLIEINGLTLHEKEPIKDVNKIKLELVINARKLKLKQGYVNRSLDEEKQYIRILKEWFNDEKKFIDEISTLLKVSPVQQSGTGEEQQKPEWSALKNNFDRTPISEVYDHLKKGLVDKGHLSENELIKYLEYAFDKKQVPEILFKLKNIQTKQKIIRIFYQYYKNVAGKPHGKQRQYVTLLCNYYEGYDIKNVSTNFNK